jgi:hypothetical protein
MARELIRDIADHLQYYGYSTTVEEGILKPLRVPPGQPYVWVWPMNGGATLRTVYSIGPTAKEDAAGFYTFLNRANQLSVISRFLLTGDFMSVEAWYPPAYDKDAFALFFNRYCADISAPVADDQQRCSDSFRQLRQAGRDLTAALCASRTALGFLFGTRSNSRCT